MVVVISAVFVSSFCDIPETFTSYTPASVRPSAEIVTVTSSEAPEARETDAELSVASASPDVDRSITSVVLPSFVILRV